MRGPASRGTPSRAGPARGHARPDTAPRRHRGRRSHGPHARRRRRGRQEPPRLRPRRGRLRGPCRREDPDGRLLQAAARAESPRRDEGRPARLGGAHRRHDDAVRDEGRRPPRPRLGGSRAAPAPVDPRHGHGAPQGVRPRAGGTVRVRDALRRRLGPRLGRGLRGGDARRGRPDERRGRGGIRRRRPEDGGGAGNGFRARNGLPAPVRGAEDVRGAVDPGPHRDRDLPGRHAPDHPGDLPVPRVRAPAREDRRRGPQGGRRALRGAGGSASPLLRLRGLRARPRFQLPRASQGRGGGERAADGLLGRRIRPVGPSLTRAGRTGGFPRFPGRPGRRRSWAPAASRSTRPPSSRRTTSRAGSGPRASRSTSSTRARWRAGCLPPRTSTPSPRE